MWSSSTANIEYPKPGCDGNPDVNITMSSNHNEDSTMSSVNYCGNNTVSETDYVGDSGIPSKHIGNSGMPINHFKHFDLAGYHSGDPNLLYPDNHPENPVAGSDTTHNTDAFFSLTDPQTVEKTNEKTGNNFDRNLDRIVSES